MKTGIVKAGMASAADPDPGRLDEKSLSKVEEDTKPKKSPSAAAQRNYTAKLGILFLPPASGSDRAS